MKNFNSYLAAFLITTFSTGYSHAKETIVLNCSGEQLGVNVLTLRPLDSQFNNEIIQIEKINDEITSVILDDQKLSKEPKATSPRSPDFLRWFEQDATGIITYGKYIKDNNPPKWNIKLSSQGVYELQGNGLKRKGTCNVQKKAF